MDAGVAYLGGLLWLPRERFDLNILKVGLTFTPANAYNKGVPKLIRAWADKPFHIGVPIHALGDIYSPGFKQIFRDMGVPLRDLRPKTWEKFPVISRVVLDAVRGGDTQERAFRALMTNEAGILVLSCGVGKSVIALHAAAQFQAPFIVVVPDKGIAHQWKGEIERHLIMPNGRPPDIGMVGEGRKQWDRPIVIGIINSLSMVSGTLDQDIRRRFAASVWDECDMLGSHEFGKAAPLFLGRRLGLSATPKRQDGLEELYYLHLGKPIMTDLMQELKPMFYFYQVKAKIDPEDPTFKSYVMPAGVVETSNLFTYLAGVRERTEEIASLIRRAMEAGRKILVLTRRRFMLDQLSELLPEAGVIHGDVKGQLREDRVRGSNVLLAQLRLGYKALNKQELDMLVVCEPVKWEGLFQQIVGRVQRYRPDKPTPIVIFVEDQIGKCIGLCKKLKRLIVTWPADQGGPYTWRHMQS